MSNEKVIIDVFSTDEEEDDYIGDCDETDDEEAEDTSLSDDDSDWSRDDDVDDDDDDDDDDADSEIDYGDEDATREHGDDDDHHHNYDGDVEDKINRMLNDTINLKSLNLKECKAYLRNHGLRLSGTKSVCIQRILDHSRIKDGSGKAVYPRSSFSINCKGDVCKGDTVLFTQKVHNKYANIKTSGKVMGRRTVAGQVVKESYGTFKQQHTFTIEVLWCEGIHKLPPLYPLLVKGRNLYRLMTLRQRWANEEDRVRILLEKHTRGAAARNVMRERKIKSGYVLKDGRLQKPVHVKKPGQVKTREKEKYDNQSKRFTQDIPANHLRNMNPPFQSHAPRPFNVHHSHIHPPPSYAYSVQQNQSNQRRPSPDFYSGRPAFDALQGQASFNPVIDQRRSYHNHHQTHENGGYNYGERYHRRKGTYTDRVRTLADHTRSIIPNSGYYNHGARDTWIPKYR
ncbi:unnamed protein product [Cochlearia groenlandica]